MNDKPKNDQEETGNSHHRMPFAEMMRMMVDQEGDCCGIDCTEMMSKMMEKMEADDDPMAMCKEVMDKMRGKCC